MGSSACSVVSVFLCMSGRHVSANRRGRRVIESTPLLLAGGPFLGGCCQCTHAQWVTCSLARHRHAFPKRTGVGYWTANCTLLTAQTGESPAETSGYIFFPDSALYRHAVRPECYLVPVISPRSANRLASCRRRGIASAYRPRGTSRSASHLSIRWSWRG